MDKLRIAKMFSLLTLIQSQAVLGGNSVEFGSQSEETALEKSNRIEQEKTLFEQQINILESENGPYDWRLLEYLQGLTNVLTEEGNRDEAGRILNRRLQLIRIEEGPFTQTQLLLFLNLLPTTFAGRIGNLFRITSITFDLFKHIIQIPVLSTC